MSITPKYYTTAKQLFNSFLKTQKSALQFATVQNF
jgi:hypothetical protein